MAFLSLPEATSFYTETFIPSHIFAKRTRIKYLNDLKNLETFLEKRGIQNINQITYAHFESYLAVLDEKGYAGATRKRKFSSLRSFFNFLKLNDYLKKDVTRHLSQPHYETKVPQVLSETEYKQLLRACAYEPRDAAVIELLLQTGLRLFELPRLTLDNIELPSQINHDANNIGIKKFGLINIALKGVNAFETLQSLIGKPALPITCKIHTLR